MSENANYFDLSKDELQNIPKTIEKLRGLIRWCESSDRMVCYRRKLNKALKIQQEQDFERQFVNPKFPNNATLWYPNEFKK